MSKVVRAQPSPRRAALLAWVLGMLALPSGAQVCPSLAEVTPLGEGTPGVAGVPELLAAGQPMVDQPGMGLRIVHGAPGAAAQLVVGQVGPGARLAAYGAVLHPAAPFVRVPMVLDAEGASPALFQTPSPTSPALCGMEFVAQGLVLDAAAQGGAAFTAGLRLHFGLGSAAAGPFELNGAYLVPNAGTLARPALAVGDLDANGRLDLVVPAGAGPKSDLRILRMLSDGSFAPPVPFPTMQAAGAVDLVVADLDDDGRPDVATSHADTLAKSVLLLRGLGDGSLQPFEVIGPAADGKPVALAAGDVTGDARADLIVAGWTATSVAVLAGPLGPGSAVPAALIALPAAPVTRGTRLGDVDGDGRADLIVLVGAADPRLLVARSLGGGDFAAPQTWAVGLPTGAALAAADVDGDGDCDAVVAADQTAQEQRLMVLLSDGTGGLQAALPITLSYAQIAPPVEVLLGNLDGDALPELLVTWGSFLGVRLTNLGGGSFASPVEVDHTGTRSRLADMDGDGRTDLVTLSEPWFLSSVWWQAGDGDGGFETPPALPAGMPIGPTRAADFDGDGDLDLLAWPNPGLQPLHLGIALNDGAAHFAPPSLHDVGVSVKDARVVDMDGDGALDVVTAASSGVRIHPGLGDGTLDAPVLVPLQGTLGVRAADTDGDGLPELIVGASFLPAVLRVYPNLGGLNFGAPTELPLTVPARSFDVGDLDGDGHPDAVVQAGKSVLVCAGTGGSLFAPPVAVTAPGTGIGTDFPLLLADLDGDGDLDMLRRTLDVHTEVWLNDGHGALALTQWEWWEAWETMSVADVNGDGAPDIIGSGVMLGLGGGKFTAPRPGAVPCVDGDLDGDGFPDGAGHGKLFLNRSQ